MTKNFKLFTLLAFISLFGFSTMAQDIIVLKNGEEIKSLVQEIGMEYVKYKKFDNQTGPIYNISKTEIFMIKYENGTKDVFNEVSKSPESKPDHPKQTYREEESKPVEKYPSTYSYLDNYAGIPLVLNKKRGTLTFAGTNQTIYGSEACKDFFRKNCPEAYDFYNASIRGYKSSAVFVSIGGVFVLTGIILTSTVGTLVGMPILGVGLGMEIGAIIGFSMSVKTQRKAFNIYNESCTIKTNTSTSSLFLGVTSNGACVVLNF